ncbi:MAG: isocitrate/isopropylmalate dehydrogenase family protein [Flavobacteriaceae bacterium]
MSGVEFDIALFQGDGIGPEVAKPAVELMLAAAERIGGLKLHLTDLPSGADCYVETGDALPESSVEKARAADAILLAAMGDPKVRYPDGTEITPQIDLRFILGLYAGVRPVRTIPGLPPVLANPRAADIDFILIRESTEGLFASMKKGEVLDDAIARETLEITRAGTARVVDFGFRLARKRRERGFKGELACIDKANVFRSFAFFRKVFDERAKEFPDVAVRHGYVDAMALDMVRRPWDYDVMVMENMFGDILSDLGAGLMGGLGMAPSADIGDSHAVFQPCHGTAPDIAGQGKANPTGMVLSAAMMLEWLGETHGEDRAAAAGSLLRRAVDAAFAPGDLLTVELGGSHGTAEIVSRFGRALGEVGLHDG